MANLFLISVADVVGRNYTTKEVYFLGKTNITSSFQTALQRTDVKGGKGNSILYTYYHDREVSVTVEDACFNKVWLALNAGTTTVSTGTQTYTKTESVSLTSASGTLSGSAIAGTKVGIVLSSGSILNVTATGSSITVPGAGTETVTATYDMSGSGVDYITGLTATAPAGLELVITADVKDNTGTKTHDFQITIPSFSISGNTTLDLTAEGVSRTRLEGVALNTPATTGDYYYVARFIPV